VPLFEAQRVDLRLPETATVVAGLERETLAQDPLLEPISVALDMALDDAQVALDLERTVLACGSKGCFLSLQGEVLNWERANALPAQPGYLTWSVGPGHKRQLIQGEEGALLLGDRSALQHTRERVPLLPALTGEGMLPQGPLWLYLLDLELSLNHLDRRLARAPSADARRLRIALAQVLPILLAAGLEVSSVGLSVTPEEQGLRLRLRAACPSISQARRLAAALRLGMLTLRRGRSAEQSAALARVPIRAHGRMVDVELARIQDLFPDPP
jgi:hypothetical protein